MKKFSFCVGNPPYQTEQQSSDIDGSQKNFAPSVYNYFMDAAFEIADIVELIHPARFLFDNGNTPKTWNRKMLDDEHFKVLMYESDSNLIFPALSTRLKGGIAITYRDKNKKYGPIGVYSEFPMVNSILKKVTSSNSFKSLTDIIYPRTAYRLTEKLHADYPQAINCLSDGHAYDMSSNIFERIPFVFFDEKPNDSFEYIVILGRDSKRIYKYIKKDYVACVDNLDYFKVLVPQAGGSGDFGEVLSPTQIEGPGIANTETFISIGKMKNESEAIAIQKYISTKFSRTLLSVLKRTQNENKGVWKYIPLQDFTANSDIDWNKSIKEIDQQLYQKYNLTDDEIDFIENNVKEMV